MAEDNMIDPTRRAGEQVRKCTCGDPECEATGLEPGWLKRQIELVEKDMKRWPKWMKEAAKRGWTP